MCRLSRNPGALSSWTPQGYVGLFRGYFTYAYSSFAVKEWILCLHLNASLSDRAPYLEGSRWCGHCCPNMIQTDLLYGLEPGEVGACHHGLARLQIPGGGTASRYGGQLRIYRISSCGQLTRGGRPAWGLSEVLRNTHLVN
jgi:hypothetical protein